MIFVEKVALKLAQYNGDDEGTAKSPHYIDMAKVAIEAMREPSDAMLKAFYGETEVERWLGNDWRDMIDTALKT